ncbi:hypothetical protein [Aquisalimonas sp.]|uniref:hypothetical protein n=1 Tax=Aquisalimonas sp. TaxID=1872621 RepID=UPI0025B822FD|nr:hypothetical protein [Aquisalimonas sp.]
MRRRWVLNVAVVLVALALAGVAWLDYQRPADEWRLTDLAPDDVHVVSVQYGDGTRLVIERDHAGWRISEPVTARASHFHVEQLLRLTRAPSEHRYDSTELDPQELGLIPPKIKLTFNGTAVGLGDTDAVDGLRYAMVGERVHLIPDALTPLIAGPWWNFLDRHILEQHDEPVALTTPVLAMRLRDGDWVIQRGELAQRRGDAFMADWAGVEALMARPLDSPPETEPDVRVELAGGGHRRFAATQEDGEVRLVDLDSGVAYVLSQELRHYLLTGEER